MGGTSYIYSKSSLKNARPKELRPEKKLSQK